MSSGDSEVSRRYTVLKHDVSEKEHLAYKGAGNEALQSMSTNLRDIYTDIKEDTKLMYHYKDSEALKAVTSFAQINAKNTSLGNIGVSLSKEEFVFTARRFMEAAGDDEQELDELSSAKAVEEKFNSFNWIKLGLAYYRHSGKPIPMEFLNGPLEVERKVINRLRTIDDTRGLTLTTATEIRASDMEADENTTANLIRSVFMEVRDKQGNDGDAVNFFKFFINPNSFSQSVENLFFTSFLIRDGKLKLFQGDDGIPMVTSVDIASKSNDASSDQSFHHIASFDFQTWQELIQKYSITESFLDHRSEEMDTFDENQDYESDSELEP